MRDAASLQSAASPFDCAMMTCASASDTEDGSAASLKAKSPLSCTSTSLAIPPRVPARGKPS